MTYTAAPGTTSRSQRSVAVLPLYGVMMPRVGDIEESSGMVSTERWGRAFSALVNDPSVAAIVLDMDSPGGAVSGTAELAQRVYDARGTKPIVAVANYMIASAAYWVASQADEIVMSPSAEAGSIGVWTAHLDESAALEMEGVKAELISAGKYKVEGNNLGPLTDEARQHIQSRVDAEYDAFTAAVARGRGVSKSTARGPQFGEGRMYLAQEAVQRGMADRIGTLEETIARAASGKVKMRSAESLKGSMLAAWGAVDHVDCNVTLHHGIRSVMNPGDTWESNVEDSRGDYWKCADHGLAVAAPWADQKVVDELRAASDARSAERSNATNGVDIARRRIALLR